MVKLSCIYSYRQVQTFGRGDIRRFANNASKMKKLAGFNYENLLQVCDAEHHVDQ
jgi:hypothetical protein